MTAVEWLEEQMFNLQIELKKEKISFTKYEWIRLELLEQAKKIEKEQIIKAYNISWKLRDKPYVTAEKYYNELIKSE